MIKKITLEIDGKEVELSLEAAKKLHQDLRGLFPEPFNPMPYPLPYIPAPSLPWGPFPITCDYTSPIIGDDTTAGNKWLNKQTYTAQ